MWFRHLLSCALHTLKVAGLLPAHMGTIVLCHVLHLLIFGSPACNLYSKMVVFVHGFVFLGERIVGSLLRFRMKENSSR